MTMAVRLLIGLPFRFFIENFYLLLQWRSAGHNHIELLKVHQSAVFLLPSSARLMSEKDFSAEYSYS